MQTNQTPHEEPESVVDSGLSLGQSRPHALPRNDMRGATGRETGAIPKQRALDPPDVSLLTNSSQSKMPSTLDLCSTAFSSNAYSRDNPSIGLSSQPSTSSILRPQLIKDMGSAQNGSLDANTEANRMRINQLESDLKQIQTQKQLLQQQLLQKDTQIRELQSQSRQSTLNTTPIQSQEPVIASLVESVDKFRSNVESAISRLEQRLSSLEIRVSESNRLTIGSDSSAATNSIDHQNGCHQSTQALAALLAQQKKVITVCLVLCHLSDRIRWPLRRRLKTKNDKTCYYFHRFWRMRWKAWKIIWMSIDRTAIRICDSTHA